MTTIKIDKLRRFGFTNTTYITGDFEYLGIRDKKLIKDSNLKFTTSSFTLTTFDDMFNGCVNGTFTHSLVISSGNAAKSANRMFKDCYHAKLPNIDIGESNLIECESMFENCLNAQMNGAILPKNIINAKRMFSGCKKAKFDSIKTINASATEYTETFKDCINGTFLNFSMPGPSMNKTYSFSYMFYGCENFNATNLSLENISNYVYSSDYMFYEAGLKGSTVFDNSVVSFNKLNSCVSMFDSSNFRFEDSYFKFSSKVEVNSINRLFYNTKYISDTAPTVILTDTIVNSVSTATSLLTGGFGGHYTIKDNCIKNGIKDFSEMYSKSNMKIADLRGIAYNNELSKLNTGKKKIGEQNFSSMFKDCINLTTIIGYIPSYGYTYDSMFYGCENLDADISKLFKKQPYGWTKGEDSLIQEGKNGNLFESYFMTSISNMFNGCGSIYSSSDEFDLVGLVKTVSRNLKNNGIDTDSIACYANSMPALKIATHDSLKELSYVDYFINGISSKYGVVRYNSFEEDKFDTMDGTPSEFGIHSKYARYVFGNGFYRFGGFFKDDPSKMFFVIEHPIEDYTNGDVTTFYMQSNDYSPYLTPHDFNKMYNTDSSKGTWNGYTFDKVYAAKVYNAEDGSFVGNYFVGPYTRIQYEKKVIGNVERTISIKYSMPVTYFDCYSSDLEIFELNSDN